MTTDKNGIGDPQNALLSYGISDADELALGELLIRRLANRHGCTRKHCPDPAAHARDAADMAVALEACGFVAYEPGRPVKGPRGCQNPAPPSYRRPGR